MPTNDFLPVATSAGANVKTQAAYAALASLLANGFSSGVVDSPTFNKILRQSSFVSAAIAQFVADNQSNNVADDGNIANFEANLRTAIAASLRNTTPFTASMSGAGYQKLPSGIIIQWLSTGAVPAGGHVDINWPTAFPNAVLGGTANVMGLSDNNATFSAAFGGTSAGTTTTNCRVYNHSGNGSSLGPCWVIGIGY